MNPACAQCHQADKVTIDSAYIGYTATCDCYDGAPLHSEGHGPSAPWGTTKEEAMAAWLEQNEERLES